MIFKYGIRSALRAKGRSILFAALIIFICLTLTLGMGMWYYCGGQIEILDESYSSVAILEYMGADYPNENAADSYVRAAAEKLDTEAIEDLSGVEFIEENDRTLGYIDGYIPDTLAPYEDYAVIEFIQFSENLTDGVVYCSKEEFASEYVAVNPLNNTAKIDLENLETDWLPYFEEVEGVYLRQDYETGAYTEFKEEELPKENICLKHFSSSMTHPLGYIVSTVYDYYLYTGENGAVKIVKDEQIGAQLSGKSYIYDPALGLYETAGKVVQGYSAISSDIIYAHGSVVKQNKVTEIEIGDSGFTAERGHSYILHGRYVMSDTGHDYKFAIADFYEGCETPPYQDISVQDADPIFEQYAQFYANANNNISVEASDDIASLEIFHQNILRLEQGRFPLPQEKGVCVVSGDIAKQLELRLGDSISLHLFTSEEGNRFSLSDAGDSRSLEVVGITTRAEDYYGNIWVSSGEGNFEEPLFGYQLGRVKLNNASATETLELIQELCPDGVRATLFDQGYAAAAQPIETMLNAAKAVTLAAFLGALVVIFLFAYLFVGRQRETVNVLVSLGTPSGKINRWLLSGAVIISGVSAFIGAFIGNLLIGRLVELALNAAGSMYAVDGRYSDSAIGVVREAASSADISAAPSALAFACVFILSLIFCRALLFAAHRKSGPKRGKISVRLPRGKSSYSGRGALRFARLSIFRGGWRSGVVPAAALVLSMFLGILAASSAGWEEQMDALYRDAEISGRVVSLNGRSSSNLTIPADTARRIWESGFIDDVGVALGFNYWLSDEIPEFKGLDAEENRSSWISAQPDVVALNTLAAAPEFIHSAAPEVEWLEGWDESFLADGDACSSLTQTMQFLDKGSFLDAEKSADTVACIAPRSFMEEHGLALGDEFEVNLTMSFKSEMVEHSRTFKLVGSFTKLGEDENLYVPLALWCGEDWITGDSVPDGSGRKANDPITDIEGRDWHFYNATRFSTFIFSLKEASQLENLRDYFDEAGFSRVGNIRSDRTTLLLYDRSFVETVSGLNRYISFAQLLFPVLFVLVAALGFIISWLMVFSRRMEFAVLRGLGTSRGRVFRSFFFEQALLCLAGSAAGCILLYIMTGAAVWLGYIGIFVLCYFLGTALSVAAVGRTHLMSLLSERE